MKMDQQISMVLDDLSDLETFATHGLDVQVQSYVRARNPLDHRSGLGSMVKKISFLRTKRFYCQANVGRFQIASQSADDIDGIVHRLVMGHRSGEISL